jgi:hypothetical protein
VAQVPRDNVADEEIIKLRTFVLHHVLQQPVEKLNTEVPFFTAPLNSGQVPDEPAQKCNLEPRAAFELEVHDRLEDVIDVV